MAQVVDGQLRRAGTIVLVLSVALAAQQERQQFRVDAASTNITVQVRRSGVFAFAGHDHEVAVRAATGIVTLDRTNVSRSSVRLDFNAARLEVTGKGEPADDVAEVQRVMVGERVLDVARYPKITFESRGVSLVDRAAGWLTLRIEGQLTLHGVTRPVIVPVKAHLTADRITAEGTIRLRQTDFGIEPVTAGAGTVKVKDQIDIVFSVTARRSDGG